MAQTLAVDTGELGGWYRVGVLPIERRYDRDGFPTQDFRARRRPGETATADDIDVEMAIAEAIAADDPLDPHGPTWVEPDDEPDDEPQQPETDTTEAEALGRDVAPTPEPRARRVRTRRRSAPTAPVGCPHTSGDPLGDLMNRSYVASLIGQVLTELGYESRSVTSLFVSLREMDNALEAVVTVQVGEHEQRTDRVHLGYYN